MSNPLSIDTDQVKKTLTDFINRQITQAGFTKAVVGLSGGLDSALSCLLAAEALGPENVLAVRMPYRSSSPDSLEDAQRVIDATGVQSLTIEITDMVDALVNRFPTMDALRRGNIMARMRMVVLFDQSAAFRGLVVGTSNKTEILLGYSTIYGDAACAFNPLGDLYKTQVRQLARAIGVPREVIDKPPSADLWAGQTDEADLGFTYEAVDPLLYLLVDQGCTPEECVKAGFSEKFVQNVVDRMRRNAFKRVMPPIGKIDHQGKV